MKELTRAEEQVMQLLWKLGKAFVKDIMELMPTETKYQNNIYTRKQKLRKIMNQVTGKHFRKK